MSGESGGELDAAMLDVAMLDSAPGIFALGVSAGGVASGSAVALQQFIAAVQISGVGASAAQALQAFIAQIASTGISGSNLQSLLAFIVQQISAVSVSSVTLDAWLQMTHQQGDLAQLSMQVGCETQVMQIFYELYSMQVEMSNGTYAVETNSPVVTI